jgi:hypothetical protein
MGQIPDQTGGEFARDILAILRCLKCQSELRRQDDVLVCLSCSTRYPVVKGVPRFVDQQFYTGSFGFQWLKHNTTQLDDENSKRSEKDFSLKTRLRQRTWQGSWSSTWVAAWAAMRKWQLAGPRVWWVLT